MNYTVDNDKIDLFSFLREKLVGKSKNNVKSLLTRQMVLVNNKVITKYDYVLSLDDKVSIRNTLLTSNLIGDIKIIYEDKDIIVVDKPSGILTIATEKDNDKENNLYSALSKYVKKKNGNGKIFIVHRLDKDTSGVVLFAKNQNIKMLLQDNWNDIATRIYYAVVIGNTNDKGTIKSYLKENKSLFTYSTNEKDGKLAITHYEKVKANDKYSLLKIKIDTGRRNQIRVQLSDIKHPILGDNKYGVKDKNTKRLMLHAYSLDIINPVTKKKMHFESKVPNAMLNSVC